MLFKIGFITDLASYQFNLENNSITSMYISSSKGIFTWTKYTKWNSTMPENMVVECMAFEKEVIEFIRNRQ